MNGSFEKMAFNNKGHEKQEKKKMSLEKMIYEIGYRASLFSQSKAAKGKKKSQLSDFENLILEVLDQKGTLSISDLTNIFASSSSSTVSTTVTDLWKSKKLVNKNISPENQRVTLVDINKKGKAALEKYRQEQTENFSALKQALDLRPDEEEVARKIFGKAASFFDEEIYPKKEK